MLEVSKGVFVRMATRGVTSVSPLSARRTAGRIVVRKTPTRWPMAFFIVGPTSWGCTAPFSGRLIAPEGLREVISA